MSLYYLGKYEHERRKLCRFSHAVYHVSKTAQHLLAISSDVHQPILIIFGRDVAERGCYETVLCYPTSPN